MRKTQTPQILVLVAAIGLLIAYAVTGFQIVAYLFLAFVLLLIGAALMLDYDDYLAWEKEMAQNQEAFDMLEGEK